MNFCPKCGGNLTERFVETEGRRRLICNSCDHIYYQNPKLVAGLIPVRDGRVIMLRRAIEPRHGFWTFPGGFVEMDETVEEAALRETKEEVCLDANLTRLLNVYTRPNSGIVLIVYLGSAIGGPPLAGKEALEIASFSPSEIPWNLLAFETTEWALRDWVQITETPENPS